MRHAVIETGKLLVAEQRCMFRLVLKFRAHNEFPLAKEKRPTDRNRDIHKSERDI